MKHKVIILILFFIYSVQSSFSQSFGLSPNDDGQLNPQTDFNWNYLSPAFSGQVKAKSISKSDIDTESPGSGLNQSITNVENHLFLEFIQMFY